MHPAIVRQLRLRHLYRLMELDVLRLWSSLLRNRLRCRLPILYGLYLRLCNGLRSRGRLFGHEHRNLLSAPVLWRRGCHRLWSRLLQGWLWSSYRRLYHVEQTSLGCLLLHFRHFFVNVRLFVRLCQYLSLPEPGQCFGIMLSCRGILSFLQQFFHLFPFFTGFLGLLFHRRLGGFAL